MSQMTKGRPSEAPHALGDGNLRVFGHEQAESGYFIEKVIGPGLVDDAPQILAPGSDHQGFRIGGDDPLDQRTELLAVQRVPTLDPPLDRRAQRLKMLLKIAKHFATPHIIRADPAELSPGHQSGENAESLGFHVRTGFKKKDERVTLIHHHLL